MNMLRVWACAHVRIHGRNYGCLSQDDAVAASNSGLAKANPDKEALIACGLEQMFSRVSMDDNEDDRGETQLQRIVPYTSNASLSIMAKFLSALPSKL